MNQTQLLYLSKSYIVRSRHELTFEIAARPILVGFAYLKQSVNMQNHLPAQMREDAEVMTWLQAPWFLESSSSPFGGWMSWMVTCYLQLLIISYTKLVLYKKRFDPIRNPIIWTQRFGGQETILHFFTCSFAYALLGGSTFSVPLEREAEGMRLQDGQAGEDFEKHWLHGPSWPR